MVDLALVIDCAPNVAPTTVQAIVRAESAGNPIALNVNTKNGPRTYRAESLSDALEHARREIEAGNSVDIGLMQINSRNLSSFGVALPAAFDPCTNLSMGAAILSEAYTRALRVAPHPQHALQLALSAYNTGDLRRGFANGYVARYYGRTAPRVAPAHVYSASALVHRASSAHQGTLMNPTTNQLPLLTTDETDLSLPGVQQLLSPEEAEQLGAIRETALSYEDAWDANLDITPEASADGSL
jgi:type IV secretion system protein VirB1